MKKINFNFGWKFNPEFKEEYISPAASEDGFTDADIPHNAVDTPYNYFDEEMYQTISCYRKSFNADKSWRGKAVIIEFEAVAHYAEVYLNGRLVTSHSGGYTSFTADITEFLNYDGLNVLTVKADATERNDIPPFGGVIDYLCYSGIYREVWLKIMAKEHITHAMIAPYDVLKAPKIGIKLDFNLPATADVDVKVFDAEGCVVSAFNIPSLGKESVNIKESFDSPTLWDIDNPYLYRVELSYNEDEYSYSLGFREAVFTASGFYLNGKKTKIIGLNRHQSFPNIGYAMPKSGQFADADNLKSLGINLVRTSHYPNSRHFLNRCDEIGLLVFTELPGWQHIGKSEEWRSNALKSVAEMIYDGYNHPSVVLWGVRINESGDDNELYRETNRIAHSLDDSRATGGVRCIPQSKLYEDVYTYNDFNYRGNNRPLLPKFIVTGRKPYLITEHNGHMFPTKRFDHEKKRQEHLLRHAAVVNAANGRSNTCGSIGWCYADYNTHKDFGSGDKICYHGVTDMFRIDKTAAAFYRAQQEQYPVLEITSNMEIGDVAGGQVGTVYMVTNCEEVKLYKNGRLINTFDVTKMKKKSEFKHLKNPPIVLNDIIGTQIIEENPFKMSERSCNKLKKLLLAIKKYGTIPAVIRNIFSVLFLMLRYHVTIEDFTALFGKYATTWGDKSVAYKFVGTLNGETVTTEKAACQYLTLKVKADSDTLIENETYDVTRVTVTAVSQTGTVVPYCFKSYQVETTEGIKVLGDSGSGLIGGARAFWVRTDGKSSSAKITVKSNIGTVEIPIKVIKNPVETI